MIKWILLILLAIFTTLPQAYESYSQSRCDRIEKERETIRSRLRQGYRVKEGERLKARFKSLFEELAKHCDNPKQTNRTYQRSSVYSTSNNALLHTKMPNMQFYSDSYNDPGKLKAWSEFYTLPKRCRAKGMESSDFVWCSEYRGEQKRLFEEQWNKRP
ncbi:MAG: hypothetical protein WBC41_16130 [Pseudoalteromonas nigrifaciens]|uniref:hypothetical protein n=1 Tax=Pseudoalteromonas nigrifaciens TaxID=28109 RepID=UPI003C712210|tara:strand:- start:210 stop:686 length:477 start_codon:yes stop_codon:yes gene_type:complete